MLTIQQAKKELKKGIMSYLLKGVDGEYRIPEINKLPFYMVGAPGIGKTQIVGQVAEELGIGFVSTSITHHSRNTVLGLPVITELQSQEGDIVKYTRYTMSEILADVQEKYENGEKEGILLLDEFASMAESLVAPMLAFLQTKNIGNYVLPQGWTIVLCSNPPAYNRTAREFDTAIMDRVRVLNVGFNEKEFILYGMENNLHNTILEYLRIHKNHTYICTGGKGEFVTTRGWENLSHCIMIYEQMNQEITEELVMQFIKSAEVAHSFYSFYVTVGKNLPEGTLSDILEGNDIQRYLTKVESSDATTKWGILNQLLQEITESARAHETEYSCYLRLKETYKYLSEKQEKVPEAWDYYYILRNRSQGMQSFNDQMEKEIFGEIETDKVEKDIYERLISWVDKHKMGENIDKIIENAETSKQLTNKMILKVMEKFMANVRNEIVGKMTGTNNKITNVITFFRHMKTDDGSFLDAFVERISQDQNSLNVLLLCKNKEYGRAICEVNSVLGKTLGAVPV